MNLDLTGLAEVTQSTTGEPMILPLNVIDCDVNQPRQNFDELALLDLSESVRTMGVVQPISVRPNLAAPGRYIINYGERRYRAAAMAGLQAIPAFVHRAPDSYMQVTENLHRADLSPMEMALFIRKRLDAGERRSEIAARLGYKKSYVTEHLALLESPVCVEKAYANGIASARTLYDLRRLHDEFPEQVDAWYASGAEITRESIAAFGQSVRHDEQFGDLEPAEPIEVVSSADAMEIVEVLSPLPANNAERVRHDERPARMTPNASPPVEFHAGSEEEDEERATASLNDAVAQPAGAENGIADERDVAREVAQQSVRKDTRGERLGGESRLDRSEKHPRVKVRHCGRDALVEEDSIVRIRFGDGEMAEVPLADTTVVGIIAYQ